MRGSTKYQVQSTKTRAGDGERVIKSGQAMPIDQEKLKKLIALVEENGLTELAVEEDGLSIVIKAEPDAARLAVLVPPAQDPTAVEVPPGPIPAAPAAGEEVDKAHLFRIESPMVGVFYHTPSPDDPPYVKVGDEIEVGQTIGLIEAMKMFSEVPSEVAGRVAAIPAESGKLVQEGDVLVIVDTSGNE